MRYNTYIFVLVLLTANCFSQLAHNNHKKFENSGWVLEYATSNQYFIGGNIDSRKSYFDILFGIDYISNSNISLLAKIEYGFSVIKIHSHALTLGIAGYGGRNFSKAAYHDFFFKAPFCVIGYKLQLSENYTVSISLPIGPTIHQQFKDKIKIFDSVETINQMYIKVCIYAK
jgi:hypothetical protein